MMSLLDRITRHYSDIFFVEHVWEQCTATPLQSTKWQPHTQHTLALLARTQTTQSPAYASLACDDPSEQDLHAQIKDLETALQILQPWGMSQPYPAPEIPTIAPLPETPTPKPASTPTLADECVKVENWLSDFKRQNPQILSINARLTRRTRRFFCGEKQSLPTTDQKLLLTNMVCERNGKRELLPAWQGQLGDLITAAPWNGKLNQPPKSERQHPDLIWSSPAVSALLVMLTIAWRQAGHDMAPVASKRVTFERFWHDKIDDLGHSIDSATTLPLPHYDPQTLPYILDNDGAYQRMPPSWRVLGERRVPTDGFGACMALPLSWTIGRRGRVTLETSIDPSCPDQSDPNAIGRFTFDLPTLWESLIAVGDNHHRIALAPLFPMRTVDVPSLAWKRSALKPK